MASSSNRHGFFGLSGFEPLSDQIEDGGFKTLSSCKTLEFGILALGNSSISTLDFIHFGVSKTDSRSSDRQIGGARHDGREGGEVANLLREESARGLLAHDVHGAGGWGDLGRLAQDVGVTREGGCVARVPLSVVRCLVRPWLTRRFRSDQLRRVALAIALRERIMPSCVVLAQKCAADARGWSSRDRERVLH